MSDCSFSNPSQDLPNYDTTSSNSSSNEHDDPDATTDDEDLTHPTRTVTATVVPEHPKHPEHPKQSKRRCHRCDRTGHFAGSCYTKTHQDGTRLPRGRLSESNPSPAKKQRPSPGIYALQDTPDCIYVGKSSDRAARIKRGAGHVLPFG